MHRFCKKSACAYSSVFTVQKLDSQPDEALKALNSLFLDTIRKVERVLRAANIESFAYNHRVNFLLSSLALSNISLSLAYRHLLSNPS